MRARFLLVLSLGLGLPLSACGTSGGGAPPGIDAGDPSDFTTPPKSCAYACPSVGCTEAIQPYTCPSMGAWAAIPHEATCPAWDGTFPVPTPTKCTVSAPSGDAMKYAGTDPTDPGTTILPDGRRIHAAGSEWIFNESDLTAGLTTGLVPIPGTSLLVTIDTGDGPHVVRVIDTTKLGSTSPVTSHLSFTAPAVLNSSAVFAPPDLLLVGTDNGVVKALKLDTTLATIVADDARAISLPSSIDDISNKAPYYVSGLALFPDKKHLLVTSVFDTRALVYDLQAGTYGTQVGSVDIGKGGTFSCAFDPNDAAGRYAYCSMWGRRVAVEIDVGNPSSPKLSRTFATDKNPQGIAFLDARWLAVSNDLGDTISLVDRVAGTVTSVPVDATTQLHGLEPSSLAYDATAKRLYATLAAKNAVAAWDVDLTATPPRLTASGKLPTSWWPSSVAVLANGALAVTSARGHSNGKLTTRFKPDEGETIDSMRGGVQVVPAPSAADLAGGEARVRAFNDVGALAGAPTVTCPNNENDFPVPPTNTQGASAHIKHIVFILRENKKFDGLFGDLPGVEGDPSLTMKQNPADLDKLWPNARAIAKTFTVGDNYYTSAELSNQGHVWTSFGRSSDFTERTWSLNGYGRNTYASPIQPQGFADIGYPDEGSLFDWLGSHNVDYYVLGEALATARQKQPELHQVLDIHYPGGFIQSLGYPDNEKACYIAGRARISCNLGQFVYATLPNDHTLGVSPGQASPEVMIAVNDEATGMAIDALSHSPMWAETLVIVTEDDPADGADHIEHHRTPIFFASPWVKRGYVSKTHMDVSSLQKLYAHVLGLPYLNDVVATAALPLDVFSSTPDYTPYTYQPRAWPLSCGTTATLAEQKLGESFDLRDIDKEPALSAQLWRWMRGQQLESLTPEMEAEIELRLRARAAGMDR